MPGGKNVIAQSVMISFLERCNDAKEKPATPLWHLLGGGYKTCQGVLA